MNSLLAFATAMMALFSPNTLPSSIENAGNLFWQDNRIPYTLSVLSNSPKNTKKYFSHRVVLTTKDWKKNRKKNLEQYFDGENIELNIWLYGEDEISFRNANRIFENTFPEVDLRFQSFSRPEQYRQALENAFSGGIIPDVIMMSNNWWPEYKRILSPLPKALFEQEECQDFFFSFSCGAFSTKTRIYAVPLFVETPIMITNRALLRDDRVTNNDRPDQTWIGFLKNGKEFTRFNTAGKTFFTALNPSGKYDHSADLFQNIMAQVNGKEGAAFQSTIKDVVENVLYPLDQYRFATKKRTSSSTKDSLLDLFLAGQTAVFFGNREDYSAIQDAFLNGDKIAVAQDDIETYALPVFSEDDIRYVSTAWGFAVPLGAKYSREASAYIAYLSHETPMKAFATDARRTSARRALASPNLFKEIADASQNHAGMTGTVAFEDIFEQNILALFSGEKTAVEVAEILLPYFSE
jgi:ABC-type glycerol-3-phosphate transport system substrate-binding protein